MKYTATPKPQEPQKPWALLLTHAVPDPLGGGQRLRAWQLLRLLSETHRVALACLEDAPVSLPQWRDLQRLASHIHIESAGSVGTRFRASLRRFTGSAHACTVHPLDSIESLPCTELHAVVATHPALTASPSLIARHARLLGPTVVDLFSATPVGPFKADTVLTPCADTPVGAYRGPVTVLPLALDRRSLRGQTGRGQLTLYPPSPSETAPTLALHGDWSQPETRRDHQRFLARIWPAIQQRVPDARLVTTAPTANHDRYQQLMQTDVLCTLPLRAADLKDDWSAAQGLCLHIPTLTPHLGHATPRPGTRAVGNDAQLVHACVELLTDPDQRHALGTAAAFHDEGQPDTAEQSRCFASALSPQNLIPQTLPLASHRRARAA